ncbi:hypothetical protein KFK09_000466 [Dendrobium nobile]|uniref:Reverse transcriptase domain-containing protein n=1 Tax=Dendrobium nobile TaxID=94219 RepID=A0A8T3C8Q4_DENNO|nr:hypothetical protein KFK09_000466 [Dendrobium nobile]
MASAFPSSAFPPLGSSAGGKVPTVPRDWSNVFAPAKDSPKAFNFSHFPEEPEVIPFSREKLLQGGEDWKLCLVGYSIGRRPYYEALLGAIKKTWSLIGSVQLLSLSDGFFLLRFSCNEDLEMAWSRGVWFLLGKPFVLQKWHPKFKPLKDDFKSVPIWVKIHDLPLACWNSEGISRIASKIGVPIAADSLTEQKSRLTFARVCVLVDFSATYPEVIIVSLDGDVVCLKVQYEWRPFPCSHCKSLMHFSSSCPSKPEVVINEENVENRGRSFSRRPHNRKYSKNPQPVKLPAEQETSSLPLNASNGGSLTDQGVSSVLGKDLHYQPHSPPPFKVVTSSTELTLVPNAAASQSDKVGVGAGIPNLNSPNHAASSSTNSLPLINNSAPKVTVSPNRFDALNIEDDSQSQTYVNKEYEDISVPDKADDGEDLQNYVGNKSQIKQPSPASKKTAKGKQALHFPPLLTAVYASNSSQDRKALWNDIGLAAPASHMPWAIIGDFNCCRFASEKLGGSDINQAALFDFNSMIFNNCLLDLQSIGCKFTWYNQRQDNPIHIKLDRVLVNDSWLNSYPDSFCSFQSPSCSDHSPILLLSGTQNQSRHRFLFKNYWTKLDEYWSLLTEILFLPHSANPLANLCNSLRSLKQKIKAQKWASSSCVSRHIELLHATQQSLLDSLHTDPSSTSLNQAYKENNAKLAEFMSLQASWIIQRAKVNWLKFGEDDLKFLYAKIRIRMGSKKSVVNLFNHNSQSSKEEVTATIINYYQELYNPIPPCNRDMAIFPVGTALAADQAQSLISFVTDGDIKAAVFSGSSKSAPGPDGINFHFYKSGWHILGSYVCRAIRSFFIKGYLPKGVKATALAIVPKKKNASNISDYRPIALCNVLYKIIAKTLATRIKPFMNLIVKDNQAGFVNSRVSTDNILLANDILFHAGKRGGEKIFCAKLDIKKAFDSVSRDFLLARLNQKGFLSTFSNWVKACVSDVNFSIVLNGALEGFFPSSAGLRQGCPLSPYLFCIVMDAFSNLLDGRGFKGITNGNFKLTHLLYADDVLIFGEASNENCQILVSVINDFANSSRLVINHDKSYIMFPKHVSNQLEVCQLLSIHTIVSKITYLGIPLSFYRLNVADFLPLLDSINKKLNGWKANLLSLAGRLQYLKFTIQNTIAYWIRGSIIPKTVHKVFKKFAFNCSVILKMYNSVSPLACWLLAKYCSPWKPPHFSASKMWKSICCTAGSVKSLFQFRIYKNSPISLKWDHWCFNSTLGNFCGMVDNFGLPDIMLKNIISMNRWDYSGVIPSLYHQTLAQFIIEEGEGPSLLWKEKNCFHFKLFIKEYYSDYNDCTWAKLVWHKNYVLKHAVFVWLALRDGLKTADALRMRHILIEVIDILIPFVDVAAQPILPLAPGNQDPLVTVKFVFVTAHLTSDTCFLDQYIAYSRSYQLLVGNGTPLPLLNFGKGILPTPSRCFEDENATLDYFIEDGKWNFSKLRQCFDEDLVKIIEGVKIYNNAIQDHLELKLQFTEAIPTKEFLFKRKLSGSCLCPMGCGLIEDIDHVTSNCLILVEVSKGIYCSDHWGAYRSNGLLLDYWHPPPPEWYKINLDAALKENYMAVLVGSEPNRATRSIPASPGQFDSTIGSSMSPSAFPGQSDPDHGRRRSEPMESKLRWSPQTESLPKAVARRLEAHELSGMVPLSTWHQSATSSTSILAVRARGRRLNRVVLPKARQTIPEFSNGSPELPRSPSTCLRAPRPSLPSLRANSGERLRRPARSHTSSRSPVAASEGNLLAFVS